MFCADVSNACDEGVFVGDERWILAVRGRFELEGELLFYKSTCDRSGALTCTSCFVGHQSQLCFIAIIYTQYHRRICDYFSSIVMCDCRLFFQHTSNFSWLIYNVIGSLHTTSSCPPRSETCRQRRCSPWYAHNASRSRNLECEFRFHWQEVILVVNDW